MSFDEPEDFDLCGVSYRATRPRANQIALVVFATKEWETYAVCKELVTYGDFDATSPAGKELVRNSVLAYRAAFARTLEIVQKMLAEDA